MDHILIRGMYGKAHSWKLRRESLSNRGCPSTFFEVVAGICSLGLHKTGSAWD